MDSHPPAADSNKRMQQRSNFLLAQVQTIAACSARRNSYVDRSGYSEFIDDERRNDPMIELPLLPLTLHLLCSCHQVRALADNRWLKSSD
jgi:hypothetical protein